MDEFVRALSESPERYKEFGGEEGKMKECMKERWREVVFTTKLSSRACGKWFCRWTKCMS